MDKTAKILVIICTGCAAATLAALVDSENVVIVATDETPANAFDLLPFIPCESMADYDFDLIDADGWETRPDSAYFGPATTPQALQPEYKPGCV